jgi:hypothetical protein
MDKRKIVITRILDKADAMIYQATAHKKKAWLITNDALPQDVENPGVNTIPFNSILLLLLLLLPYFSDPFAGYQVIAELWKSLSPDEPKPPIYFVLLVVTGQTAVVFLLGKFGKSLPGLEGFVLKFAGLLTALAIPAMAMATALAEESVKSLQTGTASTWAETLAENFYLGAFAVFSGSAHTLIWAWAEDIAKAANTVLVVVMKRMRKASGQSENDTAERERQKAEQIVISTLLADKAMEDEHPEVVFEFRYIAAHPDVVALVNKHRTTFGPDPNVPPQSDDNEEPKPMDGDEGKKAA